MAQLFQDPKSGKVYEQADDGEFYVVSEQDLAARETDPVSSAAVAFQESLRRIGRGAQMRAGQAIGSPDLYYSGLDAERESAARMAPLQRENPVSSFLGGIAPYLAAPVAGTGLAASAGTGALFGYLEPNADPASATYLGAAGGAAGWVLAAGARLARNALAARGAAGAGVDIGEQIAAETARIAREAQVGRLLAGPPGGAAGVQGTAADRVAARIRAAGAGARAELNAASGVDEGASTFDDLARQGRAQQVQEAGAQATGRNVAQELGYDPALLGGMAATGNPNHIRAWAVQVLKNAGFELTPGQETGHWLPLQVEAAARSTPYLAAPVRALDTKNQMAFNRVVNRAIGQEGDHVSLGNINAANDFVSETFAKAAEAIRQRGGVPAGGLEAKFASIIDDWKSMGIDLPNPLAKYKLDNQTFDPVGLLEARQRINGLMRDAKINTPSRLPALGDMVESIDSAIEGAARSQGENIARAREIYRVLLALDRPNAWKESGDVGASGLYRALRSGFRNEMKLRSEPSKEVRDLINVVRAREGFMREIVPDSGTATRMSLQTLLHNPVSTMAEATLGRGAMMAYLQAGKIGRRALTPQGAEQMTGIWGSTW